MICTFYSYKGGVGRSMALANIGDILARHGLRVLMIDFDLEAPGLEEFFRINQNLVRDHEGLLDLLLSYKKSMSGTSTGNSFEQLRDRFILPVYDTLPSNGRLDLLPAGQRGTEAQLTSYALNLRTFDWQDFYFKWAGEAFFEWLRNSLLHPTEPGIEPYDVVLVDSRTGVTEMGGICAYQLADTLVMLCASNHQNVEGTLNMVKNFSSPRVKTLRGNRPLKLVVVPARIEKSDDLLLANLRQRFSIAFDEYTPEEFKSEGMKFWDLMIPYEPRYAFEEQVASQQRMTSAFEKLVKAIGHLANPGMQQKLADFPTHEASTDKQAPAIPQYNVTRRFAGYDVFLSYHLRNQSEATALSEKLKTQLGLEVFLDGWELVQAESWRLRTEQALFNSGTCLVLAGPAGLGPWQQEAVQQALEEKSKATDLKVASIAITGHEDLKLELPSILRNAPVLSFSDVMKEGGVSLLRLLTSEKKKSTSIAQAVDHGAPYVGLNEFEEKHSKFFYGREKMVKRVIEKLRGGRALGVIGPSGCGKSSLIKAGVFSALRSNEVPGSNNWLLASFRPGSEPLVSLAAICNQLASSLPDGQSLKITAEAFRDDDKALDTWLRSFMVLKGDAGYGERRLVLFSDQFEELFTQCNDHNLRDTFINNLLNAANSPRNRLTLIVGLRSDFFNPVATYPRLGEWLQSNLILVPTMSRNELREAIERPAQTVGLAFEPGLIERILDDVSDSPGALPLLQFLLYELWTRRREGFLTTKGYEDCGGVAGAIANRADATYRSLSPKEQPVLQKVFLRLIQPGVGTEDTRRRAPLTELITKPEDQNIVNKVVDDLVQARLLTTSGDDESGETQVEISHEALVRGWPRLRQWIDDDRENLQIRLRLTDVAMDWKESAHDDDMLYRGARLEQAIAWKEERAYDLNVLEHEFLAASASLEQRKKRRAKLFQWATTAAAVIFLGLSFFTFMQTRKANAAVQNLTEANLEVQAQRIRLKDNNEKLEQSINELRTSEEELKRKQGESQAQQVQLKDQAFRLNIALEGEQQANKLFSLKEADARRDRDLALRALGQRETAIQASATSYSPDGNYLFFTAGNTASLVDRKTEKSSTSFNDDSTISSSVFSPDSQLIAIGSTSGEVTLYRLQTRERQFLYSHKGLVRKLTFSSDQKYLASAGDDGTITVFNFSGNSELPTLRQNSQVIDVSFDSFSKTITATGNDGKTSTWDIATGSEIRSFAIKLPCRPFEISLMTGEDFQAGLKYEYSVDKTCNQDETDSYKFSFNSQKKAGTGYNQFAYLSYKPANDVENQAIRNLVQKGLTFEQLRALENTVIPQIRRLGSPEITEVQRVQLDALIKNALMPLPATP